MSRQSINTGSGIGDPTADVTRDAFNKAEANFIELYNLQPDLSGYLPLTGGEITGNVEVTGQLDVINNDLNVNNGDLGVGLNAVIGNNLTVGNDLIVSNELTVTQDAYILGSIDANMFIGDGSQLTNVPLPSNFFDTGVPALTMTGGGTGVYTFTNNSVYYRQGNDVTMYIGLDSINTTGSPNSTLTISTLGFDVIVPSVATIGVFQGSNISSSDLPRLKAVLTTSGDEIQITNIDDTLPTGITFTGGRVILSLKFITNIF